MTADERARVAADLESVESEYAWGRILRGPATLLVGTVLLAIAFRYADLPERDATLGALVVLGAFPGIVLVGLGLFWFLADPSLLRRRSKLLSTRARAKSLLNGNVALEMRARPVRVVHDELIEDWSGFYLFDTGDGRTLIVQMSFFTMGGAEDGWPSSDFTLVTSPDKQSLWGHVYHGAAMKPSYIFPPEHITETAWFDSPTVQLVDTTLEETFEEMLTPEGMKAWRAVMS